MEKSTGIKTTGADTYVATFKAAEDAEGKERVIQIISLTSGKIDAALGAANRIVAVDDSLDSTTLTGDVEVGDNSYLACYPRHSQSSGSCLITPLLCDDAGLVIGVLESKRSNVFLPMVSGTDYLSQCLSWRVLETGAWKIFVHVSDLSAGNTATVWYYTF